MGRRLVRGGSREKPPSKDKNKEKIISSLKVISMNLFIWLLVVANLIFFVSMIFQILNSTGGEKINHIKVEEQRVKISKSLVKVEILNGCGVDRLAARLREYLINKDYDVINFMDYERFDIPKTLVIDRKNMDKKCALKIADIIGVTQKQVFPQLSPQRKLDVSIIIGKDYQDLKAFR